MSGFRNINVGGAAPRATNEKVKASIAAYNALPPIKRAIHDLEQRRSMARGAVSSESRERANAHIDTWPEYVLLAAYRELEAEIARLKDSVLTLEVRNGALVKDRRGLTAERDAAIADYREAAEARDAAGFLGSVAECIVCQDSIIADLEARLAERNRALESIATFPITDPVHNQDAANMAIMAGKLCPFDPDLRSRAPVEKEGK